MFRALAMVAVLFFTAPVTAEPLILASKYAVNGTSPGGSSYQGVATIQILSDTTFAIQWVIAGKTTKGFGMRRNDAVAASYMMNGVPGLIIYQVEGNGLDGLWAVKGEDGGGSEHLTPVQ